MQCIMYPPNWYLRSAYSPAGLQKEEVHSENEPPLLIKRIAVIQSIHFK